MCHNHIPSFPDGPDPRDGHGGGTGSFSSAVVDYLSEWIGVGFNDGGGFDRVGGAQQGAINCSGADGQVFCFPVNGSQSTIDALNRREQIGTLIGGGIVVSYIIGGTSLGALFELGVFANSGGEGPISLPRGGAQLQHIFRNAPGHLSNSATNQQLLLRVVNNPKNALGTDRFGNVWSALLRQDGTQILVQSRNGVIQNGGVNQVPRVFNPTTGLSGS